MPKSKNERYFPHEFLYKVVLSGDLEQYYEIDPKDSWIIAAAKKTSPLSFPAGRTARRAIFLQAM
jgi:deoxyhypusine synthase